MEEDKAGEKIVGGRIHKMVFASDALPAGLNDQAQFSLFRDQWNALYGAVELTRDEDRPFSTTLEFVPVGNVGLGRMQGSLNRIVRDKRAVATDGADNFCIGLSNGSTDVLSIQNNQEVVVGRNAAVLLTNAEPGEVRGNPDTGWYAINISRKRLLDLVPNADDLVGGRLDASLPALRHLGRYAEFLLASNSAGLDPALTRYLETTLVDLIALSLGAGRDAAEVARLRGLRAARLQEVLAVIKIDFADPGFSSDNLARRLGLSRRYVNDLMAESGTGFAERVMELRLQKARAMLSNRRYDTQRVADIALACGFNEVPYFNRRFRARFGCSPTQYRGGDGRPR